MKIQNLAVIFIIIILPISLILTAYVQNQVKTLGLQVEYDAKLKNATYDALKAFQLNTINSSTSDLSNSKLRDINASVNSFFNSISTNFNLSGYNKDILKDYVPALVYTMYDGYYIYSPFNNTLDTERDNEIHNDDGTITYKSDAEILDSNPNATYKNGERISGLKPYIFYSCRYKNYPISGDDFVITYSLDNYITLQGIINGKEVFDYGYLIDRSKISISGSGNVSYRGASINKELLSEYIVDSEVSEPTLYKYIKINGVKYYKNEYDKWFSTMNGVRYYTTEDFDEENSAAINYYKDALRFTNDVMGTKYNLSGLKGEHAVEEDDYEFRNDLIFDDNNIEFPNSKFNQHRLEVIRHSIEKNLSIAIANYNHYSDGVTANFLMPNLKENEWDKIINNVSIISFLQGLNIGGKIYNGYAIINNNKNKEVVNEDAIYITTSDGEYHRPNEVNTLDHLNDESNLKQGVLNIDFEIKNELNSEKENIYYNSLLIGNSPYYGCYSSIVTQREIDDVENFYKYMEDKRWKISFIIFYSIRTRKILYV